MRSLTFKLVAAFSVVAIVGVLIVALLANRFTSGEFGSYVERGVLARDQRIAAYIADRYAEGGWQSVSGAVPSLAHWTGMRLIVADASERVVVDSEGQLPPGSGLDTALELPLPIVVEGKAVGKLYLAVPSSDRWGMMGPGGMMGHMAPAGSFSMADMMGLPILDGESSERRFLEAVSRATWIAGGTAVVVATLLGLLLSSRITSPVKRLTAAASKVAAGDFFQRVDLKSRDELASLAEAFNTMAESLARTEQQRRQLLSDIAHELNTPLTIIQGNLEAMIDGVVEPTSERMVSLRDETLLLSRLVADLRDLSLAEAGHLHLRVEPVDLGELVAATVSAAQAEARMRGIDLETTVQEGLPLVAADPDRVGQVLRNLIGNALRFTPAGGTVRVAAFVGGEPAGEPSSRAGHVEVIVADTGPGISAEDLPRIFDRFFRVDRSRSRASGGTGLGLAVAKQLVEAHAGRVWADSTVGRGTTLHFTLPAAPPPGAPAL